MAHLGERELSMRARKLSGWLIDAGVAALATLWILPLAWVVLTSLKPNELLRQAGAGTWSALMTPPMTLGNYMTLLQVSQTPRWLLNSFLVAIGMTVLTLVVSLPAGYALARIQFGARRWIFALFLAGLMIPEQVILVPLHALFAGWDLHNTYFALIAPRLAGPFGVLLMTQFFRALPRDLEEAAELDHASRLRTFLTIMLPLARPAIVTLALFTFLYAWNDFLWPLVSATDSDMYTLTLGLASLQGNFAQSEGLGFLMATVVFASLPMVVVYAFFQHEIISGIGGSAQPRLAN
jgi:multiple sugar transport system permease protein